MLFLRLKFTQNLPLPFKAKRSENSIVRSLAFMGRYNSPRDGSLGEIIVGVAEFMTSILVIIALLLAFIYHSKTFFEARMSSVMTGLKIYALFIVGVSFIMPFAGLSPWLFLSVLLTGVAWLNLFARNFPFVNFLSVHFIAPFVLAVVSHCLFTIEMLSGFDCGLFETFSFFVLFVWGIPLVAASAICSLDEETSYTSKKPHLGLATALEHFARWLKRLVQLPARKLE